MRRREFIAGLGGAVATAWPLTASAQQGERIRRIGFLTNSAADDPESKGRLAAFRQALHSFGWIEGRNLRIDTRSSEANVTRLYKDAEELVALAPEAILAGVGPTVQALFQATRTIPIVFAQALDPIGAGIVESLSRPGSNATGFIQFEYSLSGKWPELLKELAPTVSRAAIVRDASNPAGIGQWAVMQALAPAVGMELTPIGVRDANEIERGLSAFARGGSGGLIAAVGASVIIHRDLIIAHAVRHRLPAVYPYRYFVAGGGLISYGPDLNSLYRQAAGYVDRILKGEKPGDLPVQAPTRYELVINLQTAKTLGLNVPPTLLARADEIIE
jgi:putative ABC transport system substrate-binding protein